MNDAIPTPEQDDDESEPIPHAIDPAFFLIIVIVITVLGLRSFAPDVRYVVVWSLLTLIAVLAILVDRIEIVRPQLADLFAGVVIGGIVGLPLLLIGSSILKRVSGDIFGATSDTSVFQILAFS